MKAMQNELPAAGWHGQFLYILGRRKIFRAEGESMLPTIKDGDLLLINTHAAPQTGDIVLARHPFIESVKIIKRVREITADGRYFLVGDNPSESTDSRSFGALLKKEILGKVEAKMN